MTFMLRLTLILTVGIILTGLSVARPNDIHPILNIEEEIFETSDQSSDCPKAEDIKPCFCKKYCEGCQIVIHCANITDVEQLEKVFNKSGDVAFKTAHFQNLTIKYFPAKSLKTKQYSGLYIRNSTQETLFDELPEENHILRSLYLDTVRVQRGIEWQQFSTLKNLHSIEVRNITLPEIGDDVGKALPEQLTSVIFSNTSTRSLGDNLFAPLKKLVNIRISDNQITVIKRSMFPKPFVGSMINLYGNKLETLPDDLFSEMSELTAIGLQNNSLTTIPERLFRSPPSNLRAVFLEGNPINCNCTLKWITEFTQYIHFEGECVAPGSKKGKHIYTLKQADFTSC